MKTVNHSNFDKTVDWLSFTLSRATKNYANFRSVKRVYCWTNTITYENFGKNNKLLVLFLSFLAKTRYKMLQTSSIYIEVKTYNVLSGRLCPQNVREAGMK